MSCPAGQPLVADLELPASPASGVASARAVSGVSMPPTISERVSRVREMGAAERSLTPPLPRSVKLELTGDCNFQCYFCPSHTRPGARGEMEWETYTRLVSRLKAYGVEQLGLFYSSEPFLCAWLPEAIRYAKQCGFAHVFLTTNGSLAFADPVRECLLAGLDSLKFTINFKSLREFSEVTGQNRDAYEAVLSNVEDARWMRDYVEHATGHRCGLHASSLAYGGDTTLTGALARVSAAVDEHYWLPLYGYPPPPRARHFRHAVKKPLPCWSLFTTAHITANGRLSACCFDPSARFDMGSLDAVTFLEAWHSPQFQALRAAHLAGDVSGTACAQCIAYGE